MILTRIKIMLEMKSRAHFMRAFNDNHCRSSERILTFSRINDLKHYDYR